MHHELVPSKKRRLRLRLICSAGTGMRGLHSQRFRQHKAKWLDSDYAYVPDFRILCRNRHSIVTCEWLQRNLPGFEKIELTAISS